MSSDSGDQGQQDLNREAQAIWDSKAAFWDERMGEGSGFHRLLVAPASDDPRCASAPAVRTACVNRAQSSNHLGGFHK